MTEQIPNDTIAAQASNMGSYAMLAGIIGMDDAGLSHKEIMSQVHELFDELDAIMPKKYRKVLRNDMEKMKLG